jgi:hypothetical protein
VLLSLKREDKIYILTTATAFPCLHSDDPPTTTRSLFTHNMEDGLQQVFILLVVFLVFLFTCVLQQREDGVIDSALLRCVSSRPTIYMLVQLLSEVPKSPFSLASSVFSDPSDPTHSPSSNWSPSLSSWGPSSSS